MEAVTAVAPERTLEQRRLALQRANAVRSHRKVLKNEIRERRRSAREVLLDPGPHDQTMKVHELLLAMPRVGRVKAGSILNRARISPAKTIGGMSQRQRTELAALLVRR